MEYMDDYEREPCAELYFGVLTATKFAELMPENRAKILSMYNVTEEDIAWQAKQEPIQSYWDEETRTGDWNRVSNSWNKIRASYNEYKAI